MMKKNLMVISITTLMFGCSVTSEMSRDEKNTAYTDYVKVQAIDPVSKVSSFSYSNWKALTDDYIILSTPRKKDFLVKLDFRCSSLKSAMGIKLNQFSRPSLHSKVDSISVVGEENNTCRIESIYPITEKQSLHIVDIGNTVNNKS
jgi:hypothetical protein